MVSTAAGRRSLAMMGGTTGASADNSVAIGSKSNAAGKNSLALMGGSSTVFAERSFVFGLNAVAQEDCSSCPGNLIAIGDGSKAFHGDGMGSYTSAISIGPSTYAENAGVAIGFMSNAGDRYNPNQSIGSVAIGSYTTAKPLGVAIGTDSEVSVARGVALGTPAKATPTKPVAIGTGRNLLTITSGGDVMVETVASGIILKSLNGSCYRVTVADGGALTTTAFTCPLTYSVF